MNDLITDVKTAITVVGGSIGSYIATVLELIPNDIGKLVSLVGLCFTLYLWKIHKEKHHLEMKIKTKQLENMKTRSED